MTKEKDITQIWYDEYSANTPYNQRYTWCLENFGPDLDYPPRWEPVGTSPTQFRFRDPKDELWFRLRWGS